MARRNIKTGADYIIKTNDVKGQYTPIDHSRRSVATITFSDSDGGSIDYNQTITIVSTDGTSVTYTTKADNDYSENEFDADGGFDDKANALKGAIEHSSGHNGKILVSRSDNVLTLTQATAGRAGDTTITENITDCTVVNFSDPDVHEQPPPFILGFRGVPTLRVRTSAE